MKQIINLKNTDLSTPIYKFIMLWKQRKGYQMDDSLTIGQVIELILATSYNLRKDDSDGRFFDRLLINEESSIAWQGEELIDILFYEAMQNIEKRIYSGGTFNEEIKDP